MNLAIIKPDHLGDLILSSSAISAVLDRHPDATVFVSPGNVSLAQFLFPPTTCVQPIIFSHLQKGHQERPLMPDLRCYDRVLILRKDAFINENWASLRCREWVITGDMQHTHQSAIDYGAATRLIGAYDPEKFFFGQRYEAVSAKAAAAPRKIGFSIGSGFHANAWPLYRWIELGRLMQKSGLSITLIGGPAEKDQLAFLSDRLGLDRTQDVILGDAFAETLDRISAVDWVVASDGGTAHLCSLVCPVLSLFGGSPFHRFAPFGRWNKVLTLNPSCSPCCQYHSQVVNCCLSIECMAGIGPEDVMEVLNHPGGMFEPNSIDLGNGRHLHVGTSHFEPGGQKNVTEMADVA